MSLDSAVLSFERRSTGLVDGGTRLTQRIVLQGEKADMYLSQVKAAFTANVPLAMSEIAAAMLKLLRLSGVNAFMVRLSRI